MSESERSVWDEDQAIDAVNFLAEWAQRTPKRPFEEWRIRERARDLRTFIINLTAQYDDLAQRLMTLGSKDVEVTKVCHHSTGCNQSPVFYTLDIGGHRGYLCQQHAEELMQYMIDHQGSLSPDMRSTSIHKIESDND